MSKTSLLFVRKLANSQLLPAFPALISKILAFFPFAPVPCKGLKLFGSRYLFENFWHQIKPIFNRRSNCLKAVTAVGIGYHIFT